MAPADPITDITQTQRIVLLVDLNPLLNLSDPTQYFAAIISSARTILSFSSLSQTLFSFKLFFSSLSPLLSSSKLPNSSRSLSFNLASSTLSSLSHALTSLPSLADPSSLNSPPRASFVASSMRQLVHDYAWDTDDPIGTCARRSVVRSNLVVLFSPVHRSANWVCEFLGDSGELLGNFDALREKLLGVFENVKRAFVSKDIHFSWVDVKSEFGCGEEVGDDGFRVFECGIRALGWGFCSTDSIVLGSAVVPFGLIYPKIGISSKLLDRDNCSKKIRAQLSLDILDVNGKPLECKCCDLEMVKLKTLPRNRCDDVMYFPESGNAQFGSSEQKNAFWEHFSVGTNKVHIKAVKRFEECVKIEGKLLDPILVCEWSGESRKRRKDDCSEFVVDTVLERVAMEIGEFMHTKSMPVWQILLSFLYRENFCALVSISDGNEHSCMGILKPFTVSSALLSVIDSENTKGGFDAKQQNLSVESQLEPTSGVLKDSKRRRNKKRSILSQELTWSAFCKAAFEHAEMNLEDVYFDRACNSSKKLRFLKCWMKQIQKSSSCSVGRTSEPEQPKDVTKENEVRLAELHQGSEQPASVSVSVSVGEESLTGASRVQDEVVLSLCSETSEAFFSSLSEKIQQGLESEGVDLGALAERLVKSSIYWLVQKCETEATSEAKSDDCYSKTVAVKLTKLLLREPKGMAEKHKNSKSSLQATDPGFTRPSSEHIVREYELQILFRMEILRSEVGTSVTESTKSKFIRHICLLLENVQCHLEGGFFGDWSLDNYVGKIIKSRYVDTLGDIVHKIYTKMDLLLFADEEEHPNPLLNSEDSNQSWRDKTGSHQLNKSKSAKTCEIVSEEDESHPPEDDNRSPLGLRREEHARRSKEAKEMRERARRFSSFSSWVPDLQRVWAPKQQKTVKAKSDSLRMLTKRINQQRARNDTVCETPITGSKRSWTPVSSSDDDEEQHISGTNSSSSISKSLFQDDCL